MPDGRVEYDVRANSDRVRQDMQQANRTVEQASQQIEQTAKKAAIGIGAALAAGTAAAVKFGSEFEASFAKASTLFGDVDVNVEKVQNRLLDLSDDQNVAASELNEGLYSALSAGIPITENADEAIAFLGKSTKLAKAGFTDVDTAISATAKTLNAYGLDVSEADRIQGVLIQTQNLGITTVGELGSVLAQVTPTAAQLGVSFEQVGAALATMTASGVQTGAATTSLNALLVELSKSGSKADMALRAATSTVQAFSAAEIQAQQDANADRVRAVSEAVQEQLRVRQEGLREERDLLKESLDEEKDLLAEAKELEIDAAQEAFDERMKLIDAEYVERLKLIDEERYNQLKAIDDQIDAINAQTEAEQKAIDDARNAEKLAELEKRVEDAKTKKEQERAEEALAEFKAKLERDALLEERAAEIDALKNQKDDVKEEFNAKKEALKQEQKDREDRAKKDFETQKQLIADVFEEQKKALDTLHSEKLKEFDKARDAEIRQLRKAGDARVRETQRAGTAAVDAMKAVTGDGKGFAELIESGMDVTEVLAILEEEAERSGISMADLFGSVEASKAALILAAEDGAKFQGALADMADTSGLVDETFNKVADTTKEKFGKNVNELRNDLIKVFNAMKDTINKVFDFIDALKAGETEAKLIGIALGTLTTLVGLFIIQQNLATAGLTIWQGVAALATAATSTLGAAFAFLTSPIGIAVLAIGALIAIGILVKDNWTEISAFLEETWTYVAETATEIWTGISEWFTETLTALKEFFIETWNGITEATAAFLDGVKKAFMDRWTQIKAVIAEAVQAIKTTLTEGFDAAFKFITDLLSGYVTSIQEFVRLMKENFNEITDFIRNVFTGNWQGAMDNIRNIFKNTFDSFRALAAAPINAVIKVFNKFFDQLSDFKVPDWVPGIGGESIEFKKFEEIRLANGGLAFGETLATVGDNPGASYDPEVIAPLSKLKSMIFGSAPFTSGGQNVNNMNIELKGSVNMDGVEVGEIVLNNVDESKRFL